MSPIPCRVPVAPPASRRRPLLWLALALAPASAGAQARPDVRPEPRPDADTVRAAPLATAGAALAELQTQLQAHAQADSLFREARSALVAEQYERAAVLFRLLREQLRDQVREREGRGTNGQMLAYATYWEAFALNRLGNLHAAQAVLEGRDIPAGTVQGRPIGFSPKGGTPTAEVTPVDRQALQGRILAAQARAGDRVAEGRLLSSATTAATDPGCPSSAEDERIAALQGVAQLAPDTALRILVRVLRRREPCTQQLRRTAVFLLGASGRPDWGRELLPVLTGDPDLEVRKQAVLFAANALPEESAPALLELALTADDEGMRRAATRGLAHGRRPQDAARRLGQLYDQSANGGVRRDVLLLLADLPAKAGVEKLMAVVRTEKNVSLRRVAVEQLVRTKDPRALALLEEILNR